MINTTLATICAVALLGLIVYTQGRRIWLRRRGRASRCDACGRAVAQRPVEIEHGGRRLTFCCQHCAEAYIRSHPDTNGGGERQD